MAPFFLETDEVSAESVERFIREHIFLLRPPELPSGQKRWPGSVGIELEMLPIKTDESIPKTIPISDGSPNIQESIIDPIIEQSWSIKSEPTGGGRTQISRVTMGKGDNLSFEPGGQLEISTLPYACLSEAEVRIKEVQETIDGAVKAGSSSIALPQIGLNPWHSVEDIGLQLPKRRYQAMDEFFSSIGPYGQRMMRQTCTIQVCLDFGRTERQMARRYIGSQLLSPFAAGIFAFSGVLEGKKVEKGLRRKIWANTDPSRTGLVLTPAMLQKQSKSSLVQAYFDFVLNAKVCFIADLEFEVPENLTFKSWMSEGYKGTKPTFADLKTHLSLLFPEVRPRGFLEIRSVDCQARAWQFVPAAFYTGILYDDQNLDWLIDRFGNNLGKIQEFMVCAEQGLSDPDFRTASQEVMQKSLEGFDRLPDCFRGEGTEVSLMRFKEHFTDRGRCPSDDIMEVTSSGLSWKSLQQLNQKWEKLASIHSS